MSARRIRLRRASVTAAALEKESSPSSQNLAEDDIQIDEVPVERKEDSAKESERHGSPQTAYKDDVEMTDVQPERH